LYLKPTVWFYMLYCIWNIQFGVICCIVFGIYSLVLYVVLYWNIQFGTQFGFIPCIVFGTYSLVLYVVLYLEHLFIEIFVCTYCIVFELSLHIKTLCLYTVLYFRCPFIKKMWF